MIEKDLFPRRKAAIFGQMYLPDLLGSKLALKCQAFLRRAEFDNRL
jgi:hypothetical protein